MSPKSGLPSENYWTGFEPDDDDLDFVINLLLDREVPLTTQDMAVELIGFRLNKIANEIKDAETPEYSSYLPSNEIRVGEVLIFPAMGNAVGEVVGLRPGENPEVGPFDVIQVEFQGNGQRREFASKLEVHRLNDPPVIEEGEDQLGSAEAIHLRHGSFFETQLETRLHDAEEIVLIGGRWFPRTLVAEITEGHLNLAEAVLDVAEGGPLPTSDLLEHVELPPGLKPQLAEFSLDYALQEDERFDEVGPAGEMLWFLRRLEPPEVQYLPPRLESTGGTVDRSLLSEDLIELEKSLDDELNPIETTQYPVQEVTLSLLFPHWRVGALPLSSRLRPLFPTAYEAPRIRFILVDGHNGEKFPGWVVRKEGYVFGLDEWYRRYEVPAGGFIRVRPGEDRGEVIVETLDRRMGNDWIRTVTIGEDGQIGFTMLKQPIGTAYDDLMVIGLIDPTVLDEAWLVGKQSKQSVERVIAHVFRELTKLTPQGAVHAQTLYAGVNVIQRMAPAVVFTELAMRPYYVHVGDLYWRFETSAWSQS